MAECLSTIDLTLNAECDNLYVLGFQMPDDRVTQQCEISNSCLNMMGTNYNGWQTQPNVPTVQGTVENALTKLTKTPIQIIGAGRTDSGVHAAGQVANFRTPSQIPLIAFQKGLNATLPRELLLSVLQQRCPPIFMRVSVRHVGGIGTRF